MRPRVTMNTRLPPVTRGGAASRRRAGASWLALGLTAIVAVAASALSSPLGASDGYRLSLVSGIGTAVLTASLWAVLLRWPAQRRAADAPLLLGASLLTLAVVYRLGVEVLDNLINAGNPPFAIASGPGVDPLLETAAGAVGAWLLALGVGRLGSSRSRAPSMVPQVVVLAAGLVAALLIAASATLPGWGPEDRVAVLVSAVGALGWAALGRAALVGAPLSTGRWLVLSGAILMLGRVGLNAVGLLATHRVSGPLGSYDTYVAVAILGFVAWVSLCVGFALVASRSSSLHRPPSRPAR